MPHEYEVVRSQCLGGLSYPLVLGDHVACVLKLYCGQRSPSAASSSGVMSRAGELAQTPAEIAYLTARAEMYTTRD